MRLAVIDVLDRDGHARQTVPVLRWPVTIGRAVDCDVILDDVHAAAHHATIVDVDGQLSLESGESINGVEWSGTRLKAGEAARLPAGAVFQIGATRLRLRRAGDALAPERALLPDLPSGRVPLAAMIVALVAWTLGSQWLGTDPGGRTIDYLPILLLTFIGLVIWCLLWAFVSKIFRHRFEFWPHTRIAVRYVLASEVVSAVLPVLAFMTGWVFLSRIAGFAAGALTAAMVVAHLSRILPARRHALAIMMAAIFVVGAGVLITRNYQVQDRVFGELYVSTLAPPALRLAAPVEPARFIDEARALKAVLDAHVGDDDPDDEFGELRVTGRRAGR